MEVSKEFHEEGSDQGNEKYYTEIYLSEDEIEEVNSHYLSSVAEYKKFLEHHEVTDIPSLSPTKQHEMLKKARHQLFISRIPWMQNQILCYGIR